MQRPCDSCGQVYEAKRPSSQFCGDRCRKRAQRAPKPANVTPLPQQGGDGGLVAATREELEEAGRLDSVLGAHLLNLAGRLASTHDTAAGIASLSKEFRAVRAEVMAGVAKAADPIDQLREARERKRRAVG